jgi:hypothetical protein
MCERTSQKKKKVCTCYNNEAQRCQICFSKEIMLLYIDTRILLGNLDKPYLSADGYSKYTININNPVYLAIIYKYIVLQITIRFKAHFFLFFLILYIFLFTNHSGGLVNNRVWSMGMHYSGTIFSYPYVYISVFFYFPTRESIGRSS